MSDEQLPLLKANNPRRDLQEFLTATRTIFLAMAAHGGENADAYHRLANRAAQHKAMIEAEIDRDADEIAERYDRDLQDLTSRYFE